MNATKYNKIWDSCMKAKKDYEIKQAFEKYYKEGYDSLSEEEVKLIIDDRINNLMKEFKKYYRKEDLKRMYDNLCIMEFYELMSVDENFANVFQILSETYNDVFYYER